MTFEEAKKRIKECLKLCTDDYNRYKDEFMRGEAVAYKNALAILNGIDTDHELSINPEQLTLKELAHELRKIFRFRYLAYGEMFYWGQSNAVLWISGEPLTLVVRDEGGEGVPCYIHEWKGKDIIGTFAEEDLAITLDLSEYKDADGNIDYSKCIVEVER